MRLSFLVKPWARAPIGLTPVAALVFRTTGLATRHRRRTTVAFARSAPVIATPLARLLRQASRCSSVRRGGLCCAALGLCFSSGEASAARYSKREVEVQAQQSRATKPPTARATRSRRRPSLEAEQFRAVARARVARLNEAAIRKLLELIEVTEDGDPEKPDLLFRLAEHYRDKKVAFEFRARGLDEKIYLASSAGEKARLKRQQRSLSKQSKRWLIEAVKIYLKIYKSPEYRKYQRMDQALFNLAALLNDVNRREKALEVFRRLIRSYPESKYIPDALLSFAEYYFNRGDVEKALVLYQRIGKYADSPVYGYAVYKQGWCWLNLKDPARALKLFVKVIRDANKWGGSKKGKILLVKEAKKDAVRAYSHVGDPDRAWNYFRNIGGDYAMKMLEGLAGIYYDQGKFVHSIQTYKQLIRLEPRSKSLCGWQYSIVRATLSGKDKPRTVEEVRRLANVYALSRRRGLAKSSLKSCQSNASTMLRELATTWHREAQKTQDPATYRLAQHLYRDYLKTFPGESDHYRMSFYYAELLFKLERWEAAAEAYSTVVTAKPRGKYLKEAAYAAVISWKNALNVDQEIKDTAEVERRGALTPRPIPAKQKRMLQAFDTYIKYVRDSSELVPIMYRKARVYYENNHFDRAIKLFGEIATKYSAHELAVYSANLLLDSLNILKRYDDLTRWVEVFLGQPKLTANEDFHAQLRRLQGQIKRKYAEQLREKGRYRQCGETYAEIANQYKDDPKWAQLVYNAAICFEAAKLIGQAIYLRTTLIRVKPEDPLAQKALYQIGANYHGLAWYSRAADHYEKFAKQFPGEANAPKALQNAIVFRLGRGEHQRAIEDATLYAKNYGGRPKYAERTAAVVFSLGAIYKQTNRTEAILEHYKSYLRKWGRKGGADRKILAHVRIGKALWQASCPVEGVNGACIKVQRTRAKRSVRRGRRRRTTRRQCGPETKNNIEIVKRKSSLVAKAQAHFRQALKLHQRLGARAIAADDEEEAKRRQAKLDFAVASARFYQAEAEFERFLDVEFPERLDFSGRDRRRLRESNRRFAQYLRKKGKLLARARTVYQAVIQTRVAHWVIAAAARIGQLFQNYADALYTAPVPKPPIPKQLRSRQQRREFVELFNDAYCEKLERQAGTLETKAVEGLAVCLSKSTELSWYNDWSSLCERELNQIKPAEYPLASEIRAEPRYVDVSPVRAGVIEAVN